YGEHEGKDFYEPLLEFVTASPVVVAVAEGLNAVANVRSILGPTFGPDAPGGTIRGDFGASRRYNLAHGSDSLESAKREIALLFAPEELLDYELLTSNWVYAKHLGKLI
ncbi:MAG: nucleoside-diphosphate kinase, partial [Planctomycetota bacterium]